MGGLRRGGDCSGEVGAGGGAVLSGKSAERVDCRYRFDGGGDRMGEARVERALRAAWSLSMTRARSPWKWLRRAVTVATSCSGKCMSVWRRSSRRRAASAARAGEPWDEECGMGRRAVEEERGVAKEWREDEGGGGGVARVGVTGGSGSCAKDWEACGDGKGSCSTGGG